MENAFLYLPIGLLAKRMIIALASKVFAAGILVSASKTLVFQLFEQSGELLFDLSQTEIINNYKAEYPQRKNEDGN
jgi:hypothetical protein